VSTATDAYFLVRATCLTPAAAIESHAPVPHLEEHAGGEAELASAPGGAEEVVGDEERGGRRWYPRAAGTGCGRSSTAARVAVASPDFAYLLNGTTARRRQPGSIPLGQNLSNLLT